MRPQGSFFFLESRTTNLLWLGLLGLVVIFFFMLVFEAVAIESRIGKQVGLQLEKYGYERAQVVVSGRDVALVGEVSSRTATQRAINIARSVDGVRAVTANMTIAPLRLSHIRLQRDQVGGMEVSGELASVGAIEDLKAQLGIFDSKQKVVNFQVQHVAEVTESPWLGILGEILEVAGKIENLLIEVGAYRVVVGGSVSSPAHYSEALVKIQDAAERHDLAVVNRLATIDRLN